MGESKMKDMIKVTVFLTVACAISALLLSFTYVMTFERISNQKTEEILVSLKQEVLAKANNIKTENDHFVGLDKNGKKIGSAYRVSPKGYGGSIDMIVGLDNNGSVVGVKIISMKETPGLGSRANERSFLKQFIGRSNKSSLKAKKDFDAITGATITSQAVANGIKEAQVIFRNAK
jgi:Na+-translocating ferredoxin:NAD+ oxidoreductase subunit G